MCCSDGGFTKGYWWWSIPRLSPAGHRRQVIDLLCFCCRCYWSDVCMSLCSYIAARFISSVSLCVCVCVDVVCTYIFVCWRSMTMFGMCSLSPELSSFYWIKLQRTFLASQLEHMLASCCYCWLITFRASHRRREIYCGHAHLCVNVSVCLSVCLSVRLSVCPSVRLSVCPWLHAYTIARTRM